MGLLAAFILVPLIEIALFIQVGGWLGLWPTLAIVVATAILGSWLVRSQGRAELGKLRASLNDLNDPTEPLAHGAMILFSGALLLTPGFFTDLVGFSLLIPQVRAAAFRAIKARINISVMGPPEAPRPRETVIDGEWEDLGDPPRRDGTPSGWTRH